ncbi:MAG TPA: DUF1499 domain-containing protein [Candidatus Binataceae bacterium]|nr:DUF1499 domain-containing protein [Candidatus Binataceae bacterium]
MIPAWLAFYDGMIAIALFLAGMLGAYFRLIAPFVGFQLAMIWGTFIALIGTIVGIVAMVRTGAPERAGGRPRAKVGLVMSLIVFVPVAVLVLSGLKYPGINDITTDFTNPPEFTHAQALAANRGRDLKYNQARFMAAQQKGYPPLAPLHLADPPAAAFERVKQLAAAMPAWSITSTDPATMTIEGVSTSSLFHFQDDFVIQVRPADGGGSIVEMRSKSRDGIGDFGVNYKRIVGFFAKLQATA